MDSNNHFKITLNSVTQLRRKMENFSSFLVELKTVTLYPDNNTIMIETFLLKKKTFVNCCCLPQKLENYD